MKQNKTISLVSVTLAMFTLKGEELCVLLKRRTENPYKGFWALPEAFRPYQTRIDKVVRSLACELCVDKDIWIEQLKTFDQPEETEGGELIVPGRDPRGDIITVGYLGLVHINKLRIYDGQEYGIKPVRSLPELAFDHRSIVDYAVRRLRSKLGYSSIGFQLLPSRFTLSELQQIYEAVLGRSINRGNFWKRVVERGVIERTGEKKTYRGRPADLYRFTNREFGLLEEPDGYVSG
jgi:8-oxo-dGTP diphosphatase